MGLNHSKRMTSKDLDKMVADNPDLAKRITIGPKASERDSKKKRKTPSTNTVSAMELLQKKPKKLGVEINDTERKLDQELRLEKLQGNILDYHYEKIGLNIAPKTWYFPDFVVYMPDGAMHVIEVKGYLRDDAAVKYKVAVGLYPSITFHMIKKSGHSWKEMYGSLLDHPEQTDGKNCRITRE